MARPLKLKPSKDPRSGQWRVNVIAKLSPGGARERRFFPNQAAALAYIEELKCRRDNLGMAPALSTAQLLDAVSAFEVLAGHSITLTQAAYTALEVAQARICSIALKDLFARFKLAKKDKSAAYRRDIAWASDRLASLADRLAHEITRSDISNVLAEMPDSSRNNILRTVRAVFRYGQDLGFLKEIPVRRNDFVEIARTEIDVLPVRKIRTLLEAALNHDITVLPLLLVETFCGLRPAEAARLLWSDIDLLRARVIIRSSVSKTGTARTIELAPCALAWFEAYGKAGGTLSGELTPFSATLLREKLRKVRYRAGYGGAGAHWTPGCLRDAFCSNHLAYYGSIDRLIQEAGHTSLRTTKDHYLGLVSAEQAAEFWDLSLPVKRAK
jgi:integrase